MSTWLDPLRATLDSATEPVTFFFRDDDAGWSDDRLYRLLDLFADQHIPIDLAVIPSALSEPLAQALVTRTQDANHPLAVHQHGFSHVNHEPTGRKYEFGPSRTREEQFIDLKNGKQRLETVLGSNIDPIFTPPWNRCTEVTVGCLKSLGYQTLSRDVTATPLELNGLSELPVSIDWLRQRNGVTIETQELGRLVAGAAARPKPVGIMLHHAVMGDEVLRDIQSLLVLLANHDNVRCRLMREIAS